jgi:hypothetical protein
VSNSIAPPFKVLSVLLGVSLLPAGCGETGPRPSTGNSGAAIGAPKNRNEPASSGDKSAANTVASKRAEPGPIDLRTLPPIEHAKFTIRTANRLEGTTGDAATAIFEHYRSALEKLGWKLSAPPTKDQVTEESASAQLNKGDDSIFLSIVPYGDPSDTKRPAERQFNVDCLATCDSGKLPRLAGAEPGYASKISSVYFTDMKVAATAASVKILLVANGWQPYTKPYTIVPALRDRIREQYRKEGNSLRVLVSPRPGKEKKPGNQNASAVEYVIGAIGHELPAPQDANDVQFDDATCLMKCSVPRDIEPVAKYYQEAMTALGFEVARILADESKTVMVCKSPDQEISIDLIYVGANTQVELRGLSPKDGKKANDAKKP